MLSANFVDTIATGKTFPRIGWYRIVSVDGAAQVVGNAASRMITVDGVDWSPMNVGVTQLWLDADGGGAMGTTGPFPTVFCTIAEGAVAVYDDVITLDNSLMRD